MAFQTDIPTEFPLPPYLDTSPETALPYGVTVSDRQISLPPEQQRLLLRPKSLVLGVGCKREFPRSICCNVRRRFWNSSG